MKKLVSLGLAVLLGLSAFTGCGSSQSKTLNIYTWEGYVPPEVVEDFQKETGIQVNYSYFSTNDEMLSKLQSQKGQYDVVICSDYIIDVMRKEGGLIQELDTAKLPNFKNIDPAFQNQYYDPENKYTIPYAAATALLVYDPDKVDFVMTGYKDLWRPELKNSVVVLDGDRDVIGMALLTMGKSVNETDPEVLEEAKNVLMPLKENIVAFDANNPQAVLQSGEAAAGYMFGSQIMAALETIPQLITVYPEEGLTFYIDNVVMPEGAPNKENALKFMNYIMDGKVSAKISSLINYPNTNTAAREFLPQEYLDNETVNIPPEKLKNVQSYGDIGDAAIIYDEIWTEFKSK